MKWQIDEKQQFYETASWLNYKLMKRQKDEKQVG
jgi:hypothetical protein